MNPASIITSVVKKVFPPRFKEPNGGVVLNYHGLVEHITEARLERNFHTYKMFEEHVRFLLKYKKIVSVQELQYAIESGKDVSDCAVITFDDGYKNNIVAREILDNIAPGIPYTIFVVTGMLGNLEESIWTVNISLLILKGKADKIVFREKGYSLKTAEERNLAFNEIRQVLKKLNTAEKNTLYQDLVQQFDKENLAELLQTYSQFLLMNWDECKQLMNAQCTIESHGLWHELQHGNQDTNVISNEIAESKRIIHEKLGHSVVSFAYPNGDHTPYSVKMLKEYGYKIAFTTKPGVVKNTDDVFLLNRISPSHEYKKFITQLSQYQ